MAMSVRHIPPVALAIAWMGMVLPASSQNSELVLQKANLIYEGAFRVPQLSCGPSYACFSYGGTALTFNPTNNSLFIVGHPNGELSAEISIPPIVNSSNLSALNTANVLQPFKDPTEGARKSVNPSTPNPNLIGGQLVYNDRLVVSVYSYYDGNGTQQTSHFVRPLNLSIAGQVSGPYKVGNQYPGFVSGYMTYVPPEWRGLFGEPALTGNCCLAIAGVQSNGPAVSVFDPSV